MNQIPIFYREEQSCANPKSYSPSAGKPKQAVADFQRRFGAKVSVHSFEPATADQLVAAHSPSYVQRVLALKEENGFGNRSPEVAASLLYTTGSMIAAARHVLTSDVDTVACSPTSGFHHAGYEYGGGYCTFNGLIVTAQVMRSEGLAKRVLIMDFDNHYGDGTHDIIKSLGLSYITHVTARQDYLDDRSCLLASQRLHHMDEDYDLVLYQAGADIHVHDPLGGILTTGEMLERDHNIFRSCWRKGIPLVWNLAGGYNVLEDGSLEPVLSLHRNTMSACINTYIKGDIDEPSTT